jgi:DNA-3-methyladenine glycosylase II
MSLSFTITPEGPFSLELAAGFGFGPRAGDDEAGLMRLAFVVDGLREQAGVVVRQDPLGSVGGEVNGIRAQSLERVRRQVARILSLDHDAGAWLRVGERDRVIGRLQAAYPGLRPVLFHSPYEAAAWVIISARLGRRQGVAVRDRIAARLGRSFRLAGAERTAFPLPRALATLESERGMSETKAARLRSLAARVQGGRLEVESLREMGPERATAELRTLAGIGPFYASLILVRACGLADVLAYEPRLGSSVARLYGLDHPPSQEEFEALAERWRPFRTWASVLVRYAATREGLVPR